VDEEFAHLGPGVAHHVTESYAEKTFGLKGVSVSIDAMEARRCALMYWRALDFSREVDRHLGQKRGDKYDLEISIDETTAPTLPSYDRSSILAWLLWRAGKNTSEFRR
jgi:hypothetical protein